MANHFFGLGDLEPYFAKVILDYELDANQNGSLDAGDSVRLSEALRDERIPLDVRRDAIPQLKTAIFVDDFVPQTPAAKQLAAQLISARSSSAMETADLRGLTVPERISILDAFGDQKGASVFGRRIIDSTPAHMRERLRLSVGANVASGTTTACAPSSSFSPVERIAIATAKQRIADVDLALRDAGILQSKERTLQISMQRSIAVLDTITDLVPRASVIFTMVTQGLVKDAQWPAGFNAERVDQALRMIAALEN